MLVRRTALKDGDRIVRLSLPSSNLSRAGQGRCTSADCSTPPCSPQKYGSIIVMEHIGLC
ncbi:MAG: hypothetical protein ACLU9S_13760 [Oscillospiraceae bacterium]